MIKNRNSEVGEQRQQKGEVVRMGKGEKRRFIFHPTGVVAVCGTYSSVLISRNAVGTLNKLSFLSHIPRKRTLKECLAIPTATESDDPLLKSRSARNES